MAHGIAKLETFLKKSFLLICQKFKILIKTDDIIELSLFKSNSDYSSVQT
jgi:hypothetical protein